MPDNLKNLFDSVPEGVRSAVLVAALLATLKVLKDDRPRKLQRVLFEIVSISCFSYPAGMIAIEYDLGTGVAVMSGALVGHYGTRGVEQLGLKILKAWRDA